MRVHVGFGVFVPRTIVLYLPRVHFFSIKTFAALPIPTSKHSHTHTHTNTQPSEYHLHSAMADLNDLFSCFESNVDSRVTSNPVVSGVPTDTNETAAPETIAVDNADDTESTVTNE